MSNLVPFNYGTVQPNQAMALKEISTRLKLRVQRTAEEMLAMGADLRQAKQVCRENDQLFTSWIASDECPVGRTTAKRLMSVHEKFSGNEIKTQKTIDGLFEQGYSVLAAVTQTTDDDIRGALLEHLQKETEQDKAVSQREVESLKKALHEERNRAKALEDGKFDVETALQRIAAERDALKEKKEEFAKDLIEGDRQRKALRQQLEAERKQRLQEARDDKEAFEMSLKEMREKIAEEERNRPRTSEEVDDQKRRLKDLRDKRDLTTAQLNEARKTLADLKARLEDERKAVRLRDQALDQFSKAAIALHRDALAILGAVDLLKQIPITDELYGQIDALRGLLGQASHALQEVTRVDAS